MTQIYWKTTLKQHQQGNPLTCGPGFLSHCLTFSAKYLSFPCWLRVCGEPVCCCVQADHNYDVQWWSRIKRQQLHCPFKEAYSESLGLLILLTPTFKETVLLRCCSLPSFILFFLSRSTILLLQHLFYAIIAIRSHSFMFTQNKTDLLPAWTRWGPRDGCSPSPEMPPTGRGSDNARSAAAQSGSGPARSPPRSSFHFAAVAMTRWRRMWRWKSGSGGWPVDRLRLGSPARLPAAELPTRKVTGWGRAKSRNWWCWIGKSSVDVFSLVIIESPSYVRLLRIKQHRKLKFKGTIPTLQLPSAVVEVMAAVVEGTVVVVVVVTGASPVVAGANELQDSTAKAAKKKALKSKFPGPVAALITLFLPVVCVRNNRMKQCRSILFQDEPSVGAKLTSAAGANQLTPPNLR